MRDLGSNIAALRERIETSERLTEADREALLEFSDELRFQRSEYSDERHLKLLQHCTVLAGETQKYGPEQLPDTELTAALEDDEAAKELVRWVHRHIPNEETNRDYRVALRMFGEHVTPGQGKPPSIEQISATTSKSYDPMPDPSNMLWWDEHVLPMVEAADYLRDQALITVAWDSGARSGELIDLTVGDVADHKHGLTISVDGKQGQRSVLLIPSVPYLRQWLQAHPDPDDPDAPLWSKLTTPEDISYEMKLKILKETARDAGVTHTEVTFTRMRKSSASYLASQNVNQAHLEDHHGWKRGSDVAARYIAVFGDANDRAIARAHGKDVQREEPDPLAPLECPRCQRETPRDRETCVWCGQVLSPEAAQSVKDQDEAIVESAAAGDGESANAAVVINQILDEYPGIREELDI